MSKGVPMKLVLDLLQQMSVFLVIAYLFTKTPMFRTLTSERLRFRETLILYLTFSAFSILGTYFGLPIRDAIANTRAIGAVLAGIVGGPALGVAVGFTGGLHRYTLGGFTAFSCAVSTTVEGLIGGLAHLYLVRRGKPEQVFSPLVAGVVTFVCEVLQMLIILSLSHPFEAAHDLVAVIAVPMTLANSIGAALFISIIRDQRGMYDKFGTIFSGRALKIAEQTLGFLERGFNRDSAAAIARIIHRETGVGAVGITDRERILAFVGIGADHHQPGTSIASDFTRETIEHNRVVFTDGVHRHFNCPLAPDCPLDSAIWVPLHVDNQVIGTIMLFEPRTKLFLNLNKTLGEGIARLLSEQLLRSRYEEQKSLLTQSELKLIQAQINPHFLFNALNTIIAVIRQDAVQARELLLHLSNFFRKNLKRSGELATLAEELDHVRSYLLIETARFGERLQVETRIDESLRQMKIPTFTLQPLIENAIKHGISELLGGGQITLSAQKADDDTLIIIEDNAGCYREAATGDGLGMGLVDKRIKNLCGERFGLSLSCKAGEWTRVTLRLPQQGCGT
jgi:two-component system LytT family sensor kinase